MKKLSDNPFININFVLESHLAEYLQTHRSYPYYMLLGEKEVRKLDKHYGCLVFEFMNMEIVEVVKSSFIGFSDKVELI